MKKIFILLSFFTFFSASAKLQAQTCNVVINTDDTGVGSLRAAIECANNHIGADTIKFNIAVAGQKVITLLSALPTLTDGSTFIDGGSWLVSNMPSIKLTGYNLNINTPNVKIKGLEFDNTYIKNQVSGNNLDFQFNVVRNTDIGLQNYADNITITSNSFLNNNKGVRNEENATINLINSNYFESNKTSDYGIINPIYNNTNVSNTVIHTIAGNTFKSLTMGIANYAFALNINSNYFGNCETAIYNTCRIDYINGGNYFEYCGKVLLNEVNPPVTIQVEGNTFNNITDEVIHNNPYNVKTKIKLGRNQFKCTVEPEIIGLTASPTISSATASQVTGTISSPSSSNFVQVYKVSACTSNPARRTIEIFVGSTTTTNANWSIQNFASPLTAGEQLVAVVTPDTSTTSPFSLPKIVACSPYTINTTQTLATCATNGLGNITLSSSTGAITSWAWANATTTGSGTGSTIIGVAAGTYSITATDVNGCTASVTNVILDHADHQQLVSWYNTGNIPATSVNWAATLNDPTMTGWTGIIKGAYGCVTTIDLYLKSISGSLPNLNLPNLQILHLGANQLTGSIPSLSATSLQNLALYGNQFSGTIPNFNLSALKVLSLSGNLLTGTIPLFNFLNLEELALNDNLLIGEIPAFSFTNIKFISVENNKLKGIVPNLNYSTTFQGLRLRKNLFTFGSLKNLTQLNHANTWYSEQDTILPAATLNNNGILTADLAGMPDASQLTYIWYLNGTPVDTIAGSNLFTPTISGAYGNF